MPPRRRSPVTAGPVIGRPTLLAVGLDPAGEWEGADVIAVGVRPGSPPRPDAVAGPAAQRYAVDLPAVIATEKVTGRAGEVLRVPVQAPAGLPGRLLLVGVGEGAPKDLRRAGAALARAVRGRARVLASLADALPDDAARALAEGLLLGGYTPPAAGLKNRAESAAVGQVDLLGDVPAAAIEAGRLHALATIRARDLAATPSNTKSPAWLAEQAVLAVQEAGGSAGEVAGGAAGEQSGLTVRVWDEHELAAEGFGGLLAVGGGSATPPRLVRIDYRPSNPRRRGGGLVVLVGKGVTYDTGGLSIKPRESMVPMKTDMAGAGAVLAAVLACMQAGVRRPVTALLPLAENAVSGSSYRPSDVVRHFGGRTVEVTNTDAEGRLVLADALAYADAELDPEIVVDVATLTGAATLGLGRRHAALFTADDRLAAGLEAAAAASGEGVWRMPLVEEYRASLDSTVADLRHIASDNTVGGGAVVAALFLREFVGGRRWAHLDIAGTGRSDRDEHEVTRGATGYGARLLLRWLETL